MQIRVPSDETRELKVGIRKCLRGDKVDGFLESLDHQKFCKLKAERAEEVVISKLIRLALNGL